MDRAGAHQSTLHAGPVMDSPWLTIVTPVRDDAEGLHHTLASITSGDTTGVEVLIIDSSSDHAIIADPWLDVAVIYRQEPLGIYAAMNLGIERARGAYVQFLNAGDLLHSCYVLEQVRNAAERSPAWMFGRTEIVDRYGNRALTPSWNYAREKGRLFSNGLFPQHQSTFVRTDLLRRLGGFDLSYSVAADYAMALRLTSYAEPQILNFVVADFHEGGVSTRDWRIALREFHRARMEILRPTGFQRTREGMNTLRHFGRVWAYRSVIEPFRARR